MIKIQNQEFDNFVVLVKALHEKKLIQEQEGKNKEESRELGNPHQRWLIKGVEFIRDQAEVESYFQTIQPLLDVQQVTNWNSFDLSKCSFWGCRIPNEIALVMKSKGAEIIECPPNFPFDPFRTSLYTQEELSYMDANILSFFFANENTSDMLTASMMAMHDQSIKNALLKYVNETGCKVVTILGGHDVKRSSAQYHDVVHLCYALVQQGFVVVSGGGPGAMEAANLGAYMHNRSQDELEMALSVMEHSTPSLRVLFEYLDTSPQSHVMQIFGPPMSNRSIGVPTWRYGKEPSNGFATRHAKFFSSALRLDALVAVANGGVIFTPGGAGTREEIFYATREHHFFPHKQAPFIFFGEKFWNENGVFQLSKQLSAGRSYHGNMICTDNVTTILQALSAFQPVRRTKR